MGISLRHDAAGIGLINDGASNRKYGQSLQLQQRKYDLDVMQRQQDQAFDVQRQANQQAFQWQMGQANNMNQAALFNAGLANRNKMAEDERNFQAEQAKTAREMAMMEQARRQEQSLLIDAIENNEFDPKVAMEIKQTWLAEAEAMTNPGLDAAQRAEVLSRARARRAELVTLRKEPMPKQPPAPTMYKDDAGREWIMQGEGKWTQIEQPESSAPRTADEALRDPAEEKRYAALAEGYLKDPIDPTKMPDRRKLWEKMRELWNIDNEERMRSAEPAYLGPMARPPVAGRPAVSSSPASTDGQRVTGLALGPGHPDYKPTPTPTGRTDGQGYVIMSDGSKVDPRDSAAMNSGGVLRQDVDRLTNPDGSPVNKDPGLKVLEAGRGGWGDVIDGPKEPTAAPANQAFDKVNEFFQKRMSSEKNPDMVYSLRAASFFAANQPPEVAGMIASLYDESVSEEKKMEIARALVANGVNLKGALKEMRSTPKAPTGAFRGYAEGYQEPNVSGVRRAPGRFGGYMDPKRK